MDRKLKRKVRRTVRHDVLGRPTGWQVLLDAAIGAAAGALGAALMGKAERAVPRIASSPRVDLSDSRAEQLPPATELAAKKVLERVGVQLYPFQQKRAGQWVHFGSGAALGALYGLVDGRARLPLLVSGLVFGLGAWAFGDELAVPRLGLSKRPNEVPLDTHIRALAAHLAFGAVTDVGFRVARRALPVV